ncbi:MAG: Gfo/Idh/MocA family oxidoreductase [Synechococcales cyanobacterium CRU_2_2]|nr:Gfo/Idh/MocA family oxidoreductase [Synechococcales cyanobacterium CRU_2_2]
MVDSIRVGLVGTGYAAKLRAQALLAETRADLVAIAGNDPSRTAEFAASYDAVATDWRSLIQRPDLDLIIIATLNRDHGPIAAAALGAGKHVVVEYPLALELEQARSLVRQAQANNLLLHVEHIELLGGLHRALLENLDRIGTPRYVRYATLAPKFPAPRRWSFHFQALGFPLIAALSRIHRLTHAFGPVASVSCQAKFWTAEDDPNYFTTCLCNAQLFFESGVLGSLTYGKGEALWQAERSLEVSGDRGALHFDNDQGCFLSANAQGDRHESPLAVGGRRGLFNQDTALVLDHLLEGHPLYVTLQDSLYALEVADATRRAAETGQTIPLVSSQARTAPALPTV